MRVVRNPAYGPPEDSGTPSGWQSPQAMSAPFVPHSPGGLRRPSDVGFTEAMTMMLLACAQSVRASTSSSTPKKLGCWMTSAAMSSPWYFARSATDNTPFGQATSSKRTPWPLVVADLAKYQGEDIAALVIQQ